ncbi:hypothetical protein GCM10010269_54410 [Streptomyces humidus]|uniref:ABC transporter n=1 Tax=Streptomyces humidus TaxID=52259 RepID=A0A918G1E1_9ACTN|nr:hypothetical protein [Streptomyces humidus]GGS08356.1 hypothetical protein GCM10010269_54410 [Streptomyces humidus]
MRPGRLWPLLVPYVLRSCRMTPLLAAAVAGWLLVGAATAVSGGLRLSDAVLLIRAGAVLLAVGAAFVLDDSAAATTEVTPVPRWLPRALRTGVAVVSAGAGWLGVLVLGARAVGPEERGLLPWAGLTLEAAGLLAVVLALAALGLRLTAGSGGGALATPGALLLVVLAALAPLPEGLQPFAPPLSRAWGSSRAVWAVLLGVAASAVVVLIREPSAAATGARDLRTAGEGR